jgi:DNA-directed RNA polymerase specialized sigma24 family protein
MDIISLDPDLRRIARVRSRTQGTDYDDLVQDARQMALTLLADGEDDRDHLLVQVWQHLSWDYQVARGAVVGVPVRVPRDAIRRARRGELAGEMEEAVRTGLAPATDLADVEVAAPTEDVTDGSVDALLDRLPAQERAALELDMAGWSDRRIATELGLGRQAVRGLLERARASARALYAGE